MRLSLKPRHLQIPPVASCKEEGDRIHGSANYASHLQSTLRRHGTGWGTHAHKLGEGTRVEEIKWSRVQSVVFGVIFILKLCVHVRACMHACMRVDDCTCVILKDRGRSHILLC